MPDYLDVNFKKWLEKLARDWHWSIADVAANLRDAEIMNRFQNYPRVAVALNAKPFDIKEFAKAVRNCWVMKYSFDAMRFNEFVSNENKASKLIRELITDFPREDEKARERIDEFIQNAIELGYRKPNKTCDWSGVAQLASLILTVAYPSRFVDYRQVRWKAFADKFKFFTPDANAQHSEWIIWSGKFAKSIASTKTYQLYWNQDLPKYSEPLWVVAGICWKGLSPSKPKSPPVEWQDVDAMSFPEGNEKRKLHLFKERNRELVRRAKAIYAEKDPLLRCQVCNFSFVEKYGERGRRIIEAHHKVPIAELKAGTKTRIEDIALVCANCHRMLHYGDRTLKVEELQVILRK